MESITVYANNIGRVDGEGDQVSVFLTGVTADQVVKEFNAQSVLDALEWSDIIAYVTEKRGEDEDE
jgi:hypothetical protein